MSTRRILINQPVQRNVTRFVWSLFTNVNMESARQKFGGCVAPIFTLHPCGKSFKHWSTSATSTSTVKKVICWFRVFFFLFVTFGYMLLYVSPCKLPRFLGTYWPNDLDVWFTYIPCIAHIPHRSHVGLMSVSCRSYAHLATDVPT